MKHHMRPDRTGAMAAGIAVAVIAGLLLVLVLVWLINYFCKRRQPVAIPPIHLPIVGPPITYIEVPPATAPTAPTAPPPSEVRRIQPKV